ncbi:MAG TPA: AAA family ATPase [Solirubrobacteraceae bacterium]|nr:AAA family ATPase [Solirubrobacteraceae bacterium]
MVAGATEGLLDRQLQTAHLQRAVDHCWHGVGRLVLIEGPAGIGKTALIGMAGELAGDAGLAVRTARGAELERSFSFGMVRQLFDSALGTADDAQRAVWCAGAAELAAPLFDPRATIDAQPAESLYARLHGLYWMCCNMAGERPQALLIDDAQWADDPSLAFLGFLARRLDELPILVVAAARSADNGSPDVLSALRAVPGTRTLRLPGLSARGVERFLAAHLGDRVEERFARACRDATAGNPFYLRELRLELGRRGIEPVAANVAQVPSLAPRRVADAVLTRLGRLSPAAPALADAIAILGDGVSLANAAAFAELDEGAALESANAMRTAELLSDEPGLAFVHPIVRAAIYDSVLPARRVARHAEAARLLHRLGAPAEQVAAQVVLAGGPRESWALAQLNLAADAAMAMGTPRNAASYLRVALAMSVGEPERVVALAAVGRAEALAGLPEAAEHLEEAVRASTDPDQRARAALDLAQLFKFTGRAPRGVELLSNLAPAADPILRDRVAIELLSAGLLNVTARDLLAARMDNIRDGHGPARDERERVELIALAYERAHANRPKAELLELVSRVQPVVDGSESGMLLPPWFTNAVAVLAFCDEYDAADAALGPVIERSRERGSIGSLLLTLSLRSQVAYRRGALADSLVDANTAYELAVGIAPGRSSMRFFPLAAICNVAVEQDRSDSELRQLLDETDTSIDRDTRHAGVGLLSRARLLLALGRDGDALEQLLQLGQLPSIFGTGSPTVVPWRSQAALIMHQLGDRAAAVRLAEEEVALARQMGANRALGSALRCYGLVHPRPAIDVLTEAVEVLAQSPARLDRARALVDLGTAMRLGGQRAASRMTLREGHELALRCGATKLADRAGREIAATGARVAPAGAGGVTSLTPSERRVAELAAQGRTNREIAQTLFVTEKTIETHLHHAYDKLGVRSRHKLGPLLTQSAVIAT